MLQIKSKPTPPQYACLSEQFEGDILVVKQFM